MRTPTGQSVVKIKWDKVYDILGAFPCMYPLNGNCDPSLLWDEISRGTAGNLSSNVTKKVSVILGTLK